MTAAPGALQFDASGLIPAVVQDAATGEVLMVAWMNAEALERTLATRLTHFWSRSRQALWQKGETSGHRQHVDAVYADCDADTLLVLAHPEGVACHTGSRTCFFTRLDRPSDPQAAPAGAPGQARESSMRSSASSNRGGHRPARARTCRGSSPGGTPGLRRRSGRRRPRWWSRPSRRSSERLVAEVADLWFHTLVLMGARGLSARHVFAELGRRHRPADGPPPRDSATVPSPED